MCGLVAVEDGEDKHDKLAVQLGLLGLSPVPG